MENFIPIFIGISAIVFRGWFARSIIDFQSRVFRRNYSDREIKSSERVAIMGGVFFIAIGILSFMGFID